VSFEEGVLTAAFLVLLLLPPLFVVYKIVGSVRRYSAVSVDDAMEQRVRYTV